MESTLDSCILNALGKAKTMGATLNQVAIELGVDPFFIEKALEDLEKRKSVSRVGRKLWILKEYENMNKDPLFIGPETYTQEFQRRFGVTLSVYSKPITFSENGTKRVHRWSPYVQGFSAEFVEDTLSRYKLSKGAKALDPFCGSGTVLVSAKMRGIDSIGVDLMPFMRFTASVKTDWDLDTERIRRFLDKFDSVKNAEIVIPKPFLRMTNKQFDPPVLNNLLRLKQFVWGVHAEDPRIGNLFKLALASILVPCSNLKRSPCLGYVRNKRVPSDAPYDLFLKKIHDMTNDLNWVHANVVSSGKAEVRGEDARASMYVENDLDIAITSPPYVNGMDYIMNYKIELVWLEFIKEYEELLELKEKMVVCDNVARITSYSPVYSDEMLDDICSRIETRIREKGSYRRGDMHFVVRKYFDDLYPVLANVYKGLRDGARFLIVVGDSLMAGIYIPADLIIARMGKSMGYEIEDILVARERRSGQRHDFKLRESIVVLRKGKAEKKIVSKTLKEFL